MYPGGYDSDEERWHEIEIAATLDCRDNVRTNRTIILFIIALLLSFSLVDGYYSIQRGEKLDLIERKIDTVTELVFIETAVRQGIPVDSLICEGEFKALWTQPFVRVRISDVSDSETINVRWIAFPDSSRKETP